MLSMLSNHMDSGKKTGGTTAYQAMETSFAQLQKKAGVCHICGKPGHVMSDCKKRDSIPTAEWYVNKAVQSHHQRAEEDSDDSDDESDQASVRSTASNNQRAWGARQACRNNCRWDILLLLFVCIGRWACLIW